MRLALDSVSYGGVRPVQTRLAADYESMLDFLRDVGHPNAHACFVFWMREHGFAAA